VQVTIVSNLFCITTHLNFDLFMKNIIILSYSACESITKEASFYTGLLLQFTKYREKIQLQLLIQ